MRRDKRMERFAKECFRLGTLRGFQHFEVEMRGREELLVMVALDAPLHAPLQSAPLATDSSHPPASPCSRERSPSGEGEVPDRGDKIVFLLGGYAHYNCPYVWVRKGHSLLGPSFEHPDTMDMPLRLKSTEAWNNRTVSAWEIVAELVSVYSLPP